MLDCAILPEDGCGAPFPGLIVEPRSLFRFLELLMTAIMSTYFQSKRKLDGSYKEKILVMQGAFSDITVQGYREDSSSFSLQSPGYISKN